MKTIDRSIAGLVVAAALYLTVHIMLALAFGGPNGSTDGREHTCNHVTSGGVTEYLADYRARCGD